jgi:hypothetical protein
MHSTDDLDDGYFGSGKIINYSVNKHGIENHKVEILEFLSSRDELKKREAEIVNEELLADPLNMNLKFGGEGGWEHIQLIRTESEQRQISALGGKALWEKHHEKMLKHLAEQNSTNHANGKIRYDRFTGKSHATETKRKISSSMKQKVSGVNNANFGKCWVHNDIESKMIPTTELEESIHQGWRKGRKFFNRSELRD